MPSPSSTSPLAFAEKLVSLLDQGSFSTTYKFAVLLGLMDVCLERTARDGSAPSMVTTQQLAEKVVELYWPHARPFEGASAKVLRQSNLGQAEIVGKVRAARERIDPSAPLSRVRIVAPAAYRSLVRTVEWKLVEMPLPRLQRFGAVEDRFIYEINWTEHIRRGEFNDETRFDNAIRFVGDAAEQLVRLAGLLRPLVQRQWTKMVAALNALGESDLEAFLFEDDLRPATAVLRGPLVELQAGRCFYCDERLRGEAVLDHFIARARHCDDSLGNLVAAHVKCNENKSDHLAAHAHVGRWHERNATRGDDLGELARVAQWEWEPERSLGVARAIYLHLPNGLKLWNAVNAFVEVDATMLAKALGA